MRLMLRASAGFPRNVIGTKIRSVKLEATKNTGIGIGMGHTVAQNAGLLETVQTQHLSALLWNQQQEMAG